MDYLSFAKNIVSEAGKTAIYYYHKPHTYHVKGEATNFATEADLACEKFIFEKIKKHFPRDSFLSEEMGMIKGASNFTWVLDPIDGTVNFSRQLLFWGVSLALFKDNQPIIGVIYLPELNNLFFAEKGKGTFLNGAKIKVSNTTILAKSIIEVGLSYPQQRKNQKLHFENFFRNFPAVIINTFSTIGPMCYVAEGKIDGFIIEDDLNWDIAAGQVIIEEAGGIVTDWQGNKISYELESKKYYQTVVSNGKVHEEILGYLK